MRPQIHRVRDKFFRELERRVGDDFLDADRQPMLQQEVNSVIAGRSNRRAVIDKIRRHHLVAGGAQDVGDVAGPTAWVPNHVRQPDVPQQRLHG